MIATHSRESIELAMLHMAQFGISHSDCRVQFAQILGMSDHCFDSLINCFIVYIYEDIYIYVG